MIHASKKARQRNALIREIDRHVRRRVFERDGNRCLRCNGDSALTPAHILPKGKYPRLRFEELNILTLCWPCHRYHWHDDPVEALVWLEQKYPGRIQLLRELAATATRPDMKELLIVLRAEAMNA